MLPKDGRKPNRFKRLGSGKLFSILLHDYSLRFIPLNIVKSIFSELSLNYTV